MKHKSIWGLAILVTVFSLLSILVIKNQALAVWSNPEANPPSTVTNTKFVFNPVTANVDVNGKRLSGVGELCLGTVCRTTWPDASSGGTGSADWKINYSASRALYYTTSSPASGNVGIGTATPTTPLHIVDAQGGLMLNGSGFYGTTNLNLGTAGNVVINPAGNVGIKTATPGYPLHITDNDNTAILNIDNVGTELWTGVRLAYDGAEKWFTGFKPGNGSYFIRSGFGAGFDALTVNRYSGNVAIGTNLAPTDNNKLYIASDTYLDPVLYAENTKYGGTAIKGVASGTSGGSLSHGVEGMAKYGIYGQSNHDEGAGVFGGAYDGRYGIEGINGRTSNSKGAGLFLGDLVIQSNTQNTNPGYKGFLQIVANNGAPLSTDCDATAERGRMIYNYASDNLYICGGIDGSVAWKTITANQVAIQDLFLVPNNFIYK